MAELHETRMGKTLIDHTIPKIAKQLERIANSLEFLEKVATVAVAQANGDTPKNGSEEEKLDIIKSLIRDNQEKE